MCHHSQLGQKCGIRSCAEKSPVPDWVQGAEHFCSNRKEELGDRFSSGGSCLEPRREGSQPGAIVGIRENAERILE